MCFNTLNFEKRKNKKTQNSTQNRNKHRCDTECEFSDAACLPSVLGAYRQLVKISFCSLFFLFFTISFLLRVCSILELERIFFLFFRLFSTPRSHRMVNRVNNVFTAFKIDDVLHIINRTLFPIRINIDRKKSHISHFFHLLDSSTDRKTLFSSAIFFYLFV